VWVHYSVVFGRVRYRVKYGTTNYVSYNTGKLYLVLPVPGSTSCNMLAKNEDISRNKEFGTNRPQLFEFYNYMFVRTGPVPGTGTCTCTVPGSRYRCEYRYFTYICRCIKVLPLLVSTVLLAVGTVVPYGIDVSVKRYRYRVPVHQGVNVQCRYTCTVRVVHI
jgi:hypothetical protein